MLALACFSAIAAVLIGGIWLIARWGQAHARDPQRPGGGPNPPGFGS